ncbi:MAG: hypothetical protein H7338_03580 [Candidatus Sericytochromatia bacterium]|nr:hypothetical protein [Candidatus Sericytochromatia bacterium]
MDLTWNGAKVDGVEVVRLPANVSLQQAAEFLTQNSDGRDTLGIQGADGDYLVLGHGLRVPGENESLSFNGQPVLPAFFENENDTKTEGYVDPRDLRVERNQIATGVTALAGGIAGGIIGKRIGGGKIGAAIGSAIGLPVAGLIHNFVFRPVARKLTGKPTKDMAQIDVSVLTRLMTSGGAVSTGGRSIRPLPTAPGLQPLDRSGLRQPAPVRPQPVAPAHTGLQQPDIGAGDKSWQGD